MRFRKFSGTPPEHRKQFGIMAKWLRIQLPKLREAVAKGDCGHAADLHANVMELYGVVSAEASWFSEYGAKGTRAGHGARKAVAAATAKFKKACVKPPRR